MSILPHYQHNVHHRRQLSRRRHVPPHFPRSISCSLTTPTTTTTTTKPSPINSSNHVIHINELPLQQPLNSEVPSSSMPRIKPPTTDLQSTWSHRAWLASGCTTILVSLAKSITGGATCHIWLEPLAAGFAGYLLADLASGVYHWGIDNYGDASTPIFGSQIEGFQGHHKWPRTITRRELANNIHALARAVTLVVVPIDLICQDPVLLGFTGACSGCIMLSQQFHAWAHGTKSKLPPVVVALQDAGVLVSRSQHAAHHRRPYNNNYCIVSGVWNELLDQHKVFEILEMVFFFKLGVRPRSWSDPNHEWSEDTTTATAH